ncbi:hypothetical protein H4R19_002023 [Coemansia spiralis]|nr:hypothetical protein H4R19_002023 [Coemansia spiralis]
MDGGICGNGPTRIVPLSAVDGLLALYNHPLVHFFENARASPDFMPTDALKASLCTALCGFPILLGHIRDTHGEASAAVVIDDSSPNTPEFVESASTVHYNDIKCAGFGWSSWPDGVATAGPVTTPTGGIVRLLSIHVVRLAANSGVILFCNIPHYVVDGVGYYAFLGRWAELFRAGGTAAPAVYTFDRMPLGRDRHEQRRPLDPMLCRILAGREVAVKALARAPFAVRTRLVALGASIAYGHAHIFHVSAAAMEALRQAVPHTAALTSYSLLTGLFGTAIFRAQAARQRAGSYMPRVAAALTRLAVSAPDGPRLLLNIVHTHHLCPPATEHYIGNRVYLHPICLAGPAADAAADFSGAACQIGQALDGVDAGLVDEFHATVEAHPLAGTSLALRMAARPDAVTFVDERHYKTSSVDFGDGGPAWVSGLPRHLLNFVAFIAAPELAGGTRVYASLDPAVVDALLRDKFFTRYAALVH